MANAKTGTEYRPAINVTDPIMLQSTTAFPPLTTSNSTPALKPKVSYSNATKTYPSKDQAIVFSALDNTKLKDYLIELGKIVTPKSITAASRISRNRICIYLESKSLVDSFMADHGGIEINGEIVPAKKLINPTRKIILSNIHPSVPDSIIQELLENNNLRLASSIKTLHIRLNDCNLFDHVSTFRRFVYVYDEKNFKLPESIRASFEGDFFRFFLSDDSLRCYLCKQNGHIASNCEYVNDPSTNKFYDEMEEDVTAATLIDPTLSVPITNAQDANTPPETLTPSAASKRPLSSSSSTFSQPTNYENTLSSSALIQKSSPAHPTPRTISPPSTPSVPTAPPTHKKMKTGTSSDSSLAPANSDISTQDLLLCTKPIFADKNFPLTFQQFCDMLEAVKGVQYPIPIVQKFTQNIHGVVQMLEDIYPALDSRTMTARCNKLKKKLANKSGNDSDSSLDDNFTSDQMETDDPQNEELSLKQIFDPLAENMSKYASRYPISLQNLMCFIDMVKDNNHAVTIAKDFTSDLQGLLITLQENHKFLVHRKTKYKFTKIMGKLRKELQKQSPPTI